MKVVLKRVAGGEIATDKRFCEWTYEGELSSFKLLGKTDSDRYSGKRNIVCVYEAALKKAIWVAPQDFITLSQQ